MTVTVKWVVDGEIDDSDLHNEVDDGANRVITPTMHGNKVCWLQAFSNEIKDGEKEL